MMACVTVPGIIHQATHCKGQIQASTVVAQLKSIPKCEFCINVNTKIANACLLLAINSNMIDFVQ